MRAWGYTAAGLMALAPAMARASDDAQQWSTLVANVNLSDRWRAQEELVFRISDNRNGLYEVESNTLVGYNIPDTKVTIWAGYTHDPQYDGGDFTVMEHRAREQVTWDDFVTLGRVKLSGRLRLEERWREGFSGTGWRLRPWIRAKLPLDKNDDTGLYVSHESFIDFNKVTFQTVTGEERMRNLIAITTKLDGHDGFITGELGYLNQHGFNPAGEDTNDHVAHVQLTFQFGKKEK